MESEDGARKSTLEQAFKEACARAWEHRTSEEYEPVRMQLYGLYKVATEGKCEAPKPDAGLGKENARRKWEAWMKASTFDKQEAMQQYVTTALSVVKRRGDAATNAAAAADAGRKSSPTASSGSAGHGRSGASLSEKAGKMSKALFTSSGSAGHGGSGASLSEKAGKMSKALFASSGSGRHSGVQGDHHVASSSSPSTTAAVSSPSVGGKDGGEGGLGEGIADDVGESSGAAAGGAGGVVSKRAEHEKSEHERLIAKLRAETEILETYLTKIHDEINIATDGLGDAESSMSGWLSKWRDREVYLWGSPKWEPRFFVLDGVSQTLTCYKSEQSVEAESVMSLKRCVLREEGSKRGKPAGRGKPTPVYHVFGLYLEGALERGPDAGVLLRLSTDDEDDANRWKAVLAKVCVTDDGSEEDWSVEGADISAADDVPPSVDVSHEVMPPLSHTPTRQLSRKGSWDIAGAAGMSNLKSLRNLSQRIQLDRSAPLLGALLDQRHDKQADTSSIDEGGSRHQLDHQKSHHKREPKKFKATGYPASRPMHKEAKPSLLSGEASSQNYRGLLNLMAILLLVTNSRLIAANLRRYGVLAQLPTFSSPGDFRHTPCFTGTLSLVLHVFFAFAVEWMAMPRPGNDKGLLGGTEAPVLTLHGLNLTVCLCLAVVVTWTADGSPVFGFGYLFTAVILWMKLISYAHANRDLRLAWRASACAAKSDGTMRSVRAASSSSLNSTHRRAGSKSAAAFGGSSKNNYPGNISLKNIAYFWFAPTLCYQLDYPKAERVRFRYVASLLLRLVILGGAMSVITDQYILPTVHEFANSDPAANWSMALERLLILAVPNTYVWLLGFYAFFHVTLNLLAELLRFGDREFYKDWWNANTIESYWRLWNLPVHYWMVRHVYFPALRAGLSKNAASTLCFLLSAVFHELLVSVPFHMVKFYAFMGMIGNVPLVPLTKSLSKIWGNDQQIGNWIFWVLFCVVGQPMSLLLYYRDYCGQHSCSNPFLSN